MELARLRRGAALSSDSGNPMNCVPQWMDFQRYKRGQQFFINHCTGILIALHSSLTIGFVLTPLLNTLVFNRASDTPGKALRRYVETLVHVILWHTTDVWDADTPSHGHLSLSFVRRVHNRVAKAMNGAKNWHQDISMLVSSNSIHLSQYDLAIVQAGFVGAVIVHPDDFGIPRPSPTELGDYVYLWRCIGYLLGIDDEYNMCSYGLQAAQDICRSIETELILPGLEQPPPNFHRMTDAYIDGLNIGAGRFGWLRPTTKESTVAYSISVMKSGERFQLPSWLHLSWSDRLRIWLMTLNVFMMKWCPGFAWLFNWFWLQVAFKYSLPLVERQLALKNFDHVDVRMSDASLVT